MPKGVDRGWFMFFVTLLNQLYWVAGATLGGLCGSLITFNTKGLDFVITALFAVIFLDRLINVNITGGSHGLPELISLCVLTALHLWHKNMLLSIACGTVCYMLLVQFVF